MGFLSNHGHSLVSARPKGEGTLRMYVSGDLLVSLALSLTLLIQITADPFLGSKQDIQLQDSGVCGLQDCKYFKYLKPWEVGLNPGELPFILSTMELTDLQWKRRAKNIHMKQNFKFVM